MFRVTIEVDLAVDDIDLFNETKRDEQMTAIDLVEDRAELSIKDLEIACDGLVEQGDYTITVKKVRDKAAMKST